MLTMTQDSVRLEFQFYGLKASDQNSLRPMTSICLIASRLSQIAIQSRVNSEQQKLSSLPLRPDCIDC